MGSSDAQLLGNKIKKLIDQLAQMVSSSKASTKSAKKRDFKGASGALNMLIDEGFFDSPKDLSSIKGKLEEIGRYYSDSLVAMNLLNLTKRRILNRLRDNKTRIWRYILRK